MSRLTPGMPIPGTEKTITAAEIAAGLGLKPGSGPREAKPRKLTPAQERLKMSGEWVGDGPDMGLEEFTVPAGRDVLDLLGIDPATLPVGVEAELGRPEPRPERRPDGEGFTEAHPTPPPPPAPLDASAADELRTAYRAHAAKVTAIAEAAKQSGDPAREARAAEEVRASAALGERLKAKLGGRL